MARECIDYCPVIEALKLAQIGEIFSEFGNVVPMSACAAALTEASRNSVNCSGPTFKHVLVEKRRLFSKKFVRERQASCGLPKSEY